MRGPIVLFLKYKLKSCYKNQNFSSVIHNSFFGITSPIVNLVHTDTSEIRDLFISYRLFFLK